MSGEPGMPRWDVIWLAADLIAGVIAAVIASLYVS